jgi:hypothetical protein
MEFRKSGDWQPDDGHTIRLRHESERTTTVPRVTMIVMSERWRKALVKERVRLHDNIMPLPSASSPLPPNQANTGSSKKGPSKKKNNNNKRRNPPGDAPTTTTTTTESSCFPDPLSTSASSSGEPEPARTRWSVVSLFVVGCAVAYALNQPHLYLSPAFSFVNFWLDSSDGSSSFVGSAGSSDSAFNENEHNSENGNPDLLEDPHDRKRRDIAPGGPPGELRPRDLPGPVLFDGFDASGTVRIVAESGEEAALDEVAYRQGQVLQINQLSTSSHPPVFSTVTHLPRLVPRKVVGKLRALLDEHSSELDVDPDTVDGMPTYEVFVDSVELRQRAPTNKVRDDPLSRDERRNALRTKLQRLTEPYAKRMAHIVRAIHPDLCNVTLQGGERRMCTPCYSLIRRYKHGERQSHPPHYDGHARVTIVVSLSEYGADYTGGLYVATGHGPQREFLNLSSGDAVLHPSTLLHGVHVYPSSSRPPSRTERWSWILWFRDSERCQDHSLQWFQECADQGNPLCQQFQASKVVHQHTEHAHQDQQHDQHQRQIEASRRIMELNTKAALGGAAEAAVKVARAYLKQLPTELEFDVNQARRFFQIAIDSHSSEGHYGMAQILVAEAAALSDQRTDQAMQQGKLKEAAAHLEQAALSMHAFSAFNLGIAHIYGYGVPRVNMERGVEWLVQSGLPEGLFLASQYAATTGDQARHDRWLRWAAVLGWDQPWRVEARRHTGSGGAAGVDLNLMWPPSVARGGIQSPEL